jgi:CheY-like chemotaxis protein
VRALDVIERNARAQTRMIDDLLDVSRVASGKLKIDAQRIALTEIVQSAVTAAQPAALARGIALESEVSAERCTVRGDPARLHQVVDNLLANALKFTAKGGRVRVTLGCRESSVELRVSDTGIGIRPELVDAIFDRFRQADSSTTRRHGGLGLGLALVKHIVELHGGCVGAESAGEARGATFTVSLPAASSEDRAGANGSSPAEPPSVSGLHVLIVDDEPEVRELLRHALEEDAAIVHDAASAPDALAEIERFHPDVLVSDIGMPVEDGYQLIQSIRGLPPERGGRTPAVALTAFARPEDCARALRSGFQVHLAKPVEPSKLLEVVARLGRVGIAPQP